MKDVERQVPTRVPPVWMQTCRLIYVGQAIPTGRLTLTLTSVGRALLTTIPTPHFHRYPTVCQFTFILLFQQGCYAHTRRSRQLLRNNLRIAKGDLATHQPLHNHARGLVITDSPLCLFGRQLVRRTTHVAQHWLSVAYASRQADPRICGPEDRLSRRVSLNASSARVGRAIWADARVFGF